ncbi:MAG TPA: hypothetical protein VE861_13655, partial [Gemmatimonadaceae bacterium]|nr:hypothetical protein [Gemmatimonadaceae bacterium]
ERSARFRRLAPVSVILIGPMIRTFTRLTVAAGLLTLAACKGDKTPTGGTTAGISISAAAPTVSVAPGAAGTVALTIGRTGSFAGAVSLTADGVPTGVTATFTPASVGAGITASSLGLTVAPSAALGTSQITIRARGTGATEGTALVALTIAASGAVAIALTPAAATVTAGQTAQTAVALTRSGGFAGGVDLTVAGAPAGVTTTFATANPVAGSAVTLSVQTAASVVPGPYTLTVRANAAGLTEATATYALTVNAPPSNSISWQFCSSARQPAWFAYQDGVTGTWQRVTESAPGRYTFAVGQPVIGVASVTNELTDVVTEVRYLALSEVTAAAAAECITNPTIGTKTVSGSVTGFGAATEAATVSLGNVSSSATGPSTPNFTITRVQDGPRDLVALRFDIQSAATLRVLLSRGLNVANGGSLGALDLAGGTSFAPATGTVTVTAPNDATIAGTNRFTTATGSGAVFGTPTLSSGVQASYTGIPEAQMIATDLQQFIASQQVGTSLSRSITRYTRGPTAVTLSMPADPGVPVITNVTGAAYSRASVSGSLPAAFNDVVSVLFDQQSRQRRWRLTSTAAARTAGAYEFTMPDFGAVAGWQATWGMAAGVADVTSAFSGQTNANPDGTPTTGTTQFTTSRKVTFTFP